MKKKGDRRGERGENETGSEILPNTVHTRTGPMVDVDQLIAILVETPLPPPPVEPTHVCVVFLFLFWFLPLLSQSRFFLAHTHISHPITATTRAREKAEEGRR